MSVVFQKTDNKEGEGHHKYNAIITVPLGYTNDPVKELGELTGQIIDLLRDVNRDGNDNTYYHVLNFLRDTALDMNSFNSLQQKGGVSCQ